MDWVPKFSRKIKCPKIPPLPRKHKTIHLSFDKNCFQWFSTRKQKKVQKLKNQFLCCTGKLRSFPFISTFSTFQNKSKKNKKIENICMFSIEHFLGVFFLPWKNREKMKLCFQVLIWEGVLFDFPFRQFICYNFVVLFFCLYFFGVGRMFLSTPH